jgi:hypothetical protein
MKKHVAWNAGLDRNRFLSQAVLTRLRHPLPSDGRGESVEVMRENGNAMRPASGSAPTDDGTPCLRRVHAPFFSDSLLGFKSIPWAMRMSNSGCRIHSRTGRKRTHRTQKGSSTFRSPNLEWRMANHGNDDWRGPSAEPQKGREGGMHSRSLMISQA